MIALSGRQDGRHFNTLLEYHDSFLVCLRQGLTITNYS